MKLFFICLVSLLTAVARAEEPTPQQALQTVVENEGKFFQLGQDQGTKAAFLAYLAPDAIVFDPAPANGPAVWKKRPDKGMSITWKPLFAAIARSADLAYTTGPAEWRKNKDDAKPIGFGQFLSIWKKQKDGNWKVALDVGSVVPGVAKSDEPPQLELAYASEPAGKADDLAIAKRKLAEAQSKFAVAAKADSTIALSEACSATVRVHRENVFPAVGKEPARLMLSVRRGKLTMDKQGGGISAAGDLAYSYGKYSLVESQHTERGYYLQIWRTESDGSWKIALDYQSPITPDEKK